MGTNAPTVDMTRVTGNNLILGDENTMFSTYDAQRCLNTVINAGGRGLDRQKVSL